jgi:hypothetical protein
MSNVQELRARPSETEKITVNLGYVDLGHVDLMVQEGFYSNRTDFIRTAIRTIASISVWAPFMTARRSRTLGGPYAVAAEPPPKSHLAASWGPDPHLHLNSIRTKEHRREQTAA